MLCFARPATILRPTGLLQRQDVETHFRPLLNFDYITLALGRGKLSFKLTNLPNSSRACAGPSSCSIPFLDLLGFVPLSHPILSPDFPKLNSSPLQSPFWLLLCIPHSFASSAGFYCACLSRGISPLLFYLSPWSSTGRGQLLPEEIRKLVLHACSSINVSFRGGCGCSLGCLGSCPLLINLA